MPFFKKQFSNGQVDASGQPYITAKETSLIVAILSLGTIVGQFPIPPLPTWFWEYVILMTWCFQVLSLLPQSLISSGEDGE